MSASEGESGSESDDASPRAVAPVIGLGRFDRVRDYIEHYLELADRTTMEDYVVYCLHECERARDAGNVERELWFYGELVKCDAAEAKRCTRRGEPAHRECAWMRELVEQRLTRVLLLAGRVEGEEGCASARAHVVAAEHYCFFREDREAALEHAGLALRIARAIQEPTSESVRCEIDALRVMRSTQAMEGNMFEAVALGSRIVAMARKEYHFGASSSREKQTIEKTTWFIEQLYEHAMTLRGWRERSARPLTAPELERYASDILKEAKTELENYWARTGTSWRNNATARNHYVSILCHLADLCDNHLDSSHVIVDEADAEEFRAKSRRLHRALAVGYRILAGTIDPSLFEEPCTFCGQPLGGLSLEDDDIEREDSLELSSLACERRHHFHASCRRIAAELTDECRTDRVLERGLPCALCAREREIERSRSRDIRRRVARPPETKDFL